MKKLVGILSLLLSVQVFADTRENLQILGGSGEDFVYTEYYRVKDDPRFQFYNLLALETVTEQFPLPAVPYNRDQQFGGWLRDNSGKTCMNTRGFVLVRDSVTEVTKTASGCTVTDGNWNDPYTGRPHLKASDIQIDHVVALKNAYMTGGHEWNAAKRCLYANFMGNNFHLLPVNGPQNMKKSDHTPAGYVPPNKKFVCEFIKDWLNIKLIWSLRITPPEGAAIQQIAQDNQCDPKQYIVPAEALHTQRQYMEAHADLCNLPTVTLEKFSAN